MAAVTDNIDRNKYLHPCICVNENKKEERKQIRFHVTINIMLHIVEMLKMFENA
jgi:hypothetical protein